MVAQEKTIVVEEIVSNPVKFTAQMHRIYYVKIVFQNTPSVFLGPESVFISKSWIWITMVISKVQFSRGSLLLSKTALAFEISYSDKMSNVSKIGK